MKLFRSAFAFSFLVSSFQIGVLVAQTNGFILNGNAAYVSASDYYRLTPASGNAFGSMWFNKRADLSKDFDVTVNLNFGTKDANGADGMVFAFQDECTSSGSPGGSLGIGGVTPSLVVKYDVFQNPNDLADDHIAITKNGSVDFSSSTFSVTGAICALTTCGNIETGQYYKTRIHWIALTKTINVYFEDVLRITYTGDIVANIFNGKPYVYWGFTAATGGFNNEQRVQIVQMPTNIVRLSNIQICQGDAKQISLPGGSNYAWTPNISISNTSISSPIIAPTSNITYFVSYSDACNNTQRDTIEVTVNPYPILNLSALSPSTICNGASAFALAGATPTGGTFSGLNITNNQFNPQTAPLGANNIIYSLLNASGCLGTIAGTINVLSTPTVTIPSFSAVCQNSAGFPLSGGFPIGGTFTGVGVLNGNFSPITAGFGLKTISYSYRDPSNFCSGSANGSILVNPKPGSTLSLSNPNFCPELASITLTSNISNSSSYTWYLNNNVLTTTTSRSIVVSQAGGYSLKNTLATGCGDTSTVQTITNAIPTSVAITSNGNTFCPNSNLSIVAGTVSGAVYQWLKNSVNVGSLSSTNTFSANTPGTYSVQVTNVLGCSTVSSNTISMSQLAAPVVTLTGTSAKVCSGSTIALNANRLNGANYQWFRNSISLGAAAINDSIKVVSISGTYFVIANNTCPGTSNNYTVTVVSLISNVGTNNSDTFCKGDENIRITKSVVPNATYYQWDILPATNASSVSGQGMRDFYINFLDKDVNVKVTPQNECGSGNPDIYNFTVDNTSNCKGIFGDNILFGAYPTNVCPNCVVTFYDYTDQSDSPFPGIASWNFGMNASPATASGSGPHNVTYSSTGLKTVEIEFLDSFGFSMLESATKTNYINVSSSFGGGLPTNIENVQNANLNENFEGLVYPVPNQGLIYINAAKLSSGNFDVDIYNTEGQNIKSIPNSNLKMVDLRSQPSGLYIIRITQGSNTFKKSFIIQK